MRIYTAALASGDGGALRIALVAAVLLHVAALFVIRVPETAPPPARAAQDRTAITIRKYLPPAPPAARRRVPRRRVERKLPVPDLTPLELEPLVEPQPVFELEPLPAEIELLIPRPEPPPLDGSLRAGVGGVTEPVRIEDSHVRPDYPAAARVDRLESNVVLEVVIRADGTVGDIKLLHCDHPAVGFEQSAIDAVEKWRYEPATLAGKPVDVYFTIAVRFTIV